MSELPKGWAYKPLENVCEILDSQRIPINNKERNLRIAGKKQDELYPYYGATGQVGHIDDYIFDGEYVLIGEDGAPFLDHSRDTAYIAKGRFWVNNHAHILKAHVSNKYLRHFLNQVDYSDYVTGTTRLKLNQARLKEILVKFPPEKEQKRIVVKIEELFSELDKGIESLKTAREQLKVYRQAVLKHAFEGKLTADWREENGLTIESWKSVFVKDVADVGTGATPKRGEKKYYEYGIYPWVTSGALNHDHVRESAEFITETALKETNCKLYKPGTILVAMYGEGKTRGKASILQIEAATNQACAAISITEESMLRDYLWNFFKYNYENIRLRSSGGVQPNLNLSHIKNIKFPLPTIEEQKIINEEIESQLSQVKNLEDEIGLNLQKLESLRQSILKQAFSGKLVAQDPNDEPASVLLERIKLNKEDSKKKRNAA